MSKIYLFLALLFLGTTSCSDFLEEYSQNLSYINTVDDLDELLLGGAYWMQTKSSIDFYLYYLNTMDDDIASINISHNVKSPGYYMRNFYTWQEYTYLSGDEGDKIYGVDAAWARFYEKIAVCNSILVDIERFVGEEKYNRIKGEALFLRAFYYFYMVNIWGEPYDKKTATTQLGIPLKTSSEVEDKDYSRNTVAECYGQIVKDAEAALSYLKGVTPSSTKRVGEQAARALLARTYLYMGEYALVVQQCDSILNSPKALALIDMNTISSSDYEDVTTHVESSELIFTGSMGQSLRSSSGYRFTISEDLISCYEESGDWRFKLNEQSHFFSYRTAKGQSFYTRWFMDGNNEWIGFGLGYPEIYLNKAEAAAMLGKNEEAISTLERLRETRIENPTSIRELSGESLVKFTRKERRRELCLSYHRWFDLRRYAVAPQYPDATTIRHEWKADDSDLENGIYVLKPYPEDGGWVLPFPTYVLEDNHGELIDNVRPVRKIESSTGE
ncbi:MAG: RagB/SusD family nutrient uptake outer membrane protein [Bacteroidales bacterium]|nr:RagB/SusD family nutrient uptake outer membrane protein [Bacteroidales bacterium]